MSANIYQINEHFNTLTSGKAITATVYAVRDNDYTLTLRPAVGRTRTLRRLSYTALRAEYAKLRDFLADEAAYGAFILKQQELFAASPRSFRSALSRKRLVRAAVFATQTAVDNAYAEAVAP